MPQRDPALTLAFTLASTPGSYAALLGAGVSMSAGVLSAWQVQQDLIAKMARIAGDSPDDLTAWYSVRYGEEPTYDRLLETLAPTTFERHSLLRGYFEGTEGESPTPTASHQALARMAAGGHIKVFLTTNFDRLLESALHAEGVEPTVVSDSASIQGLPPLHLIDCLVVHLHGDYLSPTAMLNTAGELATYDSRLDGLLDRILADYGLFILGWSATWDVALRTALRRNQARRFTTYWVEPFGLSEVASDLLVQQGAQLVSATAGDFTASLVDAVQAIRATTPDPMTRSVSVATAKRELAGREVAVPMHDRLRREHERLLVTADSLSDPNVHSQPRLDHLEDSMQVYLALMATAAYWGNASTDQWWLPDLERLAQPRIGVSGLTSVIIMRQTPALYALYAAGIASLASQRYEVVASLLNERVLHRELGGNARPLFCASPSRHIGTRGSAHLFQFLGPLFVDDLALGGNGYRDAWERFEYLRLVAATDWGLRREDSHGSDLPHIRATGYAEHREAVPRDWLLRLDPVHLGLMTDLGMFGGDLANAAAAQAAYDESFGRMADDAAWSTVTPGTAGFLPSGLFYPDEMPKWNG